MSRGQSVTLIKYKTSVCLDNYLSLKVAYRTCMNKFG